MFLPKFWISLQSEYKQLSAPARNIQILCAASSLCQRVFSICQGKEQTLVYVDCEMKVAVFKINTSTGKLCSSEHAHPLYENYWRLKMCQVFLEQNPLESVRPVTYTINVASPSAAGTTVSGLNSLNGHR